MTSGQELDRITDGWFPSDWSPADLGRPLVGSHEVLVGAFLQAYTGNTLTAYAFDLRQWFGWCRSRNHNPLRVHRPHIEAFARELEELGRSRSTVARKLTTLSSFYGFLVDEGLLARSPVTRVRRPRTDAVSQTLGLSRHEAIQFLGAAVNSSARNAALAHLMVLNGLRVSEVCVLDIQSRAKERGHEVLHVLRKGGRKDVVPLSDQCARLITLQTDERSAGPLFVSKSGMRLTRGAVSYVVKHLAEAAGIEKQLSPHSLRHTFVTLSLDAGVPLRDVQDGAGHADPRTTRRYDRGRMSLERHATYRLSEYMSES